jgi:hypothetical protein
LLLSCIIIAIPYYHRFALLCSKRQRMQQMKCIIFDNSFSMQAKGKRGELLKRAVQELLEETPEKLLFFTNEL